MDVAVVLFISRAEIRAVKSARILKKLWLSLRGFVWCMLSDKYQTFKFLVSAYKRSLSLEILSLSLAVIYVGYRKFRYLRTVSSGFSFPAY